MDEPTRKSQAEGAVSGSDIERALARAGAGATVYIPGHGYIEAGVLSNNADEGSLQTMANQQINNGNQLQAATLTPIVADEGSPQTMANQQLNNGNQLQAATLTPIATETVHVEARVLSVEKPWYKDRKTLIILVFIIIAIIASVLITMVITSSSDDARASSTSVTNEKTQIISTSFPSQSPTTDSLVVQYRALNSMFSVTNGPEWNNVDGWADSHDADNVSSVCMWHGVTCNLSSEVTKIMMPMNNIVGDINDILNSLLTIGTIEVIDLKSNGLYGNLTDATLKLAVVSSLMGIDLRYNNKSQITGHVIEDLCDMHEVGRIGYVRVDCSVDCSCCDHSSLCDCTDEEGWVDEDGYACAW